MSYFEAVERTDVSVYSPKGYCKIELRESDDGFRVEGTSCKYTGEVFGGVPQLVIEHAAPVVFSTKSEAVECIKARAQTLMEDAFAA